MRLINTKSRKFMEYVGDNVPPYAILSHTWEEGEEVTYQEFLARSNLHKKGWEKIWKACELAEEHEISLVWVDTCGIDKSSSAELSEAINSMYQWYKKSQICFAFLSDWSESDDTIESMRHCRWFTRGWTLQELIAPATVLFFDKYYTLRGSKESLVDSLADVTAVDRRLLRGLNSLADFSVAQKMSWAANRQTTRKEDQAYSLLGIFDINLPLLYGEGEKAFRRLQEEIIRTTVDLSIFGWKLRAPPSQIASQWLSDILPCYSGEPILCGVLAYSPEDFSECGSLASGVDGLREFSTSNLGIKIRTRMHLRQTEGKGGHGYVLPIAYWGKVYFGIKLRQVDHEQYLREDPYTLVESDGTRTGTVPPVERYLLTKVARFPGQFQERYTLSRLVLPERRFFLLQLKVEPNMVLSDPWPLHRFDHEDMAFFGPFNSKRDFGIINIITHIPTHASTGSEATLYIISRFCAFGWYHGGPANAQFSLIDSRKYDAEFAAMQPWVSDWDRDSEEIMLKFNQRGVPKQSGVIVKLDEWNACLVSFEAKPEKDTVMSTPIYWSITFTCNVYRTDGCPSIREERWKYSVPPFEPDKDTMTIQL